MKVTPLEALIDEMIEEGPASDPETVESLLRARDKLEAFVTSAILSSRLSRAAWNRGGLQAPRNPSGVTPP